MATKRKRLVRGRDWHAWAWRPGASWPDRDFFHWAEVAKPPKEKNPSESGRWIRVKFVEVKRGS